MLPVGGRFIAHFCGDAENDNTLEEVVQRVAAEQGIPTASVYTIECANDEDMACE